MKQLPHYKVTQEVFNEILITHKLDVVETDNLYQYYGGYKNKHTIYHQGEKLICLEYVYNYITDSVIGCTEWKQCILETNSEITECTKTINGLAAYNYMRELLEKYYDNLDDILNSYTDVDDESKSAIYYFLSEKKHAILKYSNCYKYDINSAYTDSLVEMFPKAADALKALYSRRKAEPIFKDYLNYFTGYLQHKGFSGAYWYIVHRIRAKMDKVIEEVGGKLLYARTDGFVVQNPAKLLKDSKKLGEFKLEYKGDCYMYWGDNYICMQTNKITGSCFNVVRAKMDLSKGIVAQYDIEYIKEIKTRIPKNIVYIKEETYEV